MIYKIFPSRNHDTAKLTHLILHAIATVLGAFGIYCAFKFHNDSGIADLYSLHSWLGIGTISLYSIQVRTQTPHRHTLGIRKICRSADERVNVITLQWVFGLVTFFFPSATPSVRRAALPWHALFGLFVYILALVTAELGFLEKLTFLQSGGLDKYGAEALLVNFTALVVVLFGAAVVVAAIAPVHHVDEEPQGYAPIPVS
jgi:cytochrome b-561